MTLNLDNVRKKPYLIDKLPWVGRGACTAIYPYVWLSRQAYDNLNQAIPDPYSVAVVLHEQAHLNRMKEVGVINFYFRYVCIPGFRFNEELEATKPQFAYLKRQSLAYNFEQKARQLSGWLYLRSTSYERALSSIEDLWDRA